MTSIDRQIFERLNTVLSDLLVSNGGWAKSVREDFILDGDTQVYPHEMPLIQISDEGQNLDHLRGRMDTLQEITIEIWSYSESGGGVTAGEMRDRRAEVEQLLGQNVNLGIPAGLHFRYNGNSGPVRIRDNLYLVALFLEYRFYKPFSGIC